MNNYTYPFMPINNNQQIIEELIQIKELLKRIDYKLNKKEKENNNEKDDNYYMI